jgi:hypothetical protein
MTASINVMTNLPRLSVSILIVFNYAGLPKKVIGEKPQKSVESKSVHNPNTTFSLEQLLEQTVNLR